MGGSMVVGAPKESLEAVEVWREVAIEAACVAGSLPTNPCEEGDRFFEVLPATTGTHGVEMPIPSVQPGALGWSRRAHVLAQPLQEGIPQPQKLRAARPRWRCRSAGRGGESLRNDGIEGDHDQIEREGPEHGDARPVTDAATGDALHWPLRRGLLGRSVLHLAPRPRAGSAPEAPRG